VGSGGILVVKNAAQPAAAPDAAIVGGCGVGWAYRRGFCRRLVAPAAAQVSRLPLARLNTQL
jgi:hypothetical protein